MTTGTASKATRPSALSGQNIPLHVRRDDEEPTVPVPPGEDPPPPIEEPPDKPVIAPDVPVREPGPKPARRLAPLAA